MDEQGDLVHHRSSPEAKIALFRSLFRGREDVYPSSLREPQDRQVRLSARVRQRVGPRRLRKTQGQMRRMPAIAAFLPVTDEVDSLAPFGPRRCRPRFRHGRLSHASGRDLLLPGRRFRQDPLAGGCGSRPGNLPPHEPAGRPGAIAIRQRRARLVVLRRGHPCRLGAQARRAHLSPKPWNAGRTSAWIPTTVSFPIKTRFPKAASAT